MSESLSFPPVFSEFEPGFTPEDVAWMAGNVSPTWDAHAPAVEDTDTAPTDVL